jgi:hypothetical protein
LRERSALARLLARITLLAVIAATFVWGYQAHRARWFPYALVSWVLPDGDAMPYSWVRPASRPIENLRALSYISSSFDPDSDQVGVQHHDAARAAPGLNFYYSGFSAPFLLVDMDGNEVWRWDDDPEPLIAHAELLPNGDLIVVRFDREVARMKTQLPSSIWRLARSRMSSACSTSCADRRTRS